MARRIKRYPEDRHVMRTEIRERFEALMDPVIVKAIRKKSPVWDYPKYQLWRWDTLEDCPELNK